MKFVTIKESHYQQELVVLKSRLESEGIECRLKNELTTQILNHIPAFLVELQVRETELERVKRILIESGELNADQIKIVCKKCGSDRLKINLTTKQKIQFFFTSVLIAISGKYASLDKILEKAGKRCQDCGHLN